MPKHRDASVSCHRHVFGDYCQSCQVHSLESVNEAKPHCRRGVPIGQATSCQAYWKLVAQIVRALEDAMLVSMCQSPLTCL
jgi:hypothetical protein